MKAEGQGVIPWRAGLVLLILVLLGFASWLLVSTGPESMPLGCVFHQWSDLHCVGCGMTRATFALFEGRLLAAISQNPLGMVLLPIALIGVSLEVIGWVQGKPAPWTIPLGAHGAKIIAIIVIAFMILRNLPWAPFHWLGPH
jgi:hypothetical protein